MKHTPGPWGQHSIFYHINGADNEGICEVRTTYRTKPEAEANARLIAASPELLESLKEISGCMRSWFDEFGGRDEHQAVVLNTLIKNAEKAIAKATGAE